MKRKIFTEAISSMTPEQRTKFAFDCTMKGIDLRETLPILDGVTNVLTEFFEHNLNYINSLAGGSIPYEKTSED